MVTINLDQRAAAVVIAAIQHWGGEAHSRTSGTGEVSVIVTGLKVDGKPVRIGLLVEAEVTS